MFDTSGLFVQQLQIVRTDCCLVESYVIPRVAVFRVTPLMFAAAFDKSNLFVQQQSVQVQPTQAHSKSNYF